MTLIAVVAMLALAVSGGGPATRTDTFGAELDRAARGGFAPALALEIECQIDAGMRTATVYGEGIGIWNGTTQFAIGRQQIQSLLSTLARAGFAAMPDRFGGRDETRVPREKRVTVVTCRLLVRLDDDGPEKQVVQLDAGRQSAAFKRLANDLLHALEAPAQKGIRPANLEDALRKIASGDLATLTLEVMASHGTGRVTAAKSERWMLSLTGGVLETQRQSEEGLSDPVRRRADAAALRDLARDLADNNLASLPANVFAPDYTDISVQVLAWKRSIQARPFAGKQAEPDAPDQQRFRRVLEALRAFVSASPIR